MDWREGLLSIQSKFEALASQSTGLHHLFVEVADNERERAQGPDWFVARNPGLFGGGSAVPNVGDPWDMVAGSGLASVSPTFREILQSESIDNYSASGVVRDGNGQPRALFMPQRISFGYLCGDHSAVANFKTLAGTASRLLTDVPELAQLSFAEDLLDLFRTPATVQRYVFGKVENMPAFCVARGWDAGIYEEADGVVIDVPISSTTPGVDHWLLMLHRFCWRRFPGSLLQGGRSAWDGNTTVPYEWVKQREFNRRLPESSRQRFAQIPTGSFYSVIGTRDQPLDVNLASWFAIQILVSEGVTKGEEKESRLEIADYSREAWAQNHLPLMAATELAAVIPPAIADVLLLTATTVERDTILRYLVPLHPRDTVLKIFHEQNTYYLGQFGAYPAVLCMCEMGSIGRDASLAVTGEAIRLWKPACVIMVGIAFGRDQTKQKIGDVLVADRIIAYEPQRVGSELTVTRGAQHSVGPTLLNRFRNIVRWQFQNPAGVACDIHYGPLLSGEKLVDNSEFKRELFEHFPHAIGGEMEGAGLAACAERVRCEWILVKGICDWADGNKDKQHQFFAAAAATDLVATVLGEKGVLHGLRS